MRSERDRAEAREREGGRGRFFCGKWKGERGRLRGRDSDREGQESEEEEEGGEIRDSHGWRFFELRVCGREEGRKGREDGEAADDARRKQQNATRKERKKEGKEMNKTQNTRQKEEEIEEKDADSPGPFDWGQDAHRGRCKRCVPTSRLSASRTCCVLETGTKFVAKQNRD